MFLLFSFDYLEWSSHEGPLDIHNSLPWLKPKYSYLYDKGTLFPVLPWEKNVVEDRL